MAPLVFAAHVEDGIPSGTAVGGRGCVCGGGGAASATQPSLGIAYHTSTGAFMAFVLKVITRLFLPNINLERHLRLISAVPVLCDDRVRWKSAVSQIKDSFIYLVCHFMSLVLYFY